MNAVDTSAGVGTSQAGRDRLGGSTASSRGRAADAGYFDRRGEIETYFDRTAAEAWARLTSDAPVGRVRASVRAGRERMRATLLSWLPDDLRGRRLLDAGCGTGALAVEAAHRGAEVVAIDLSPTLVDLARERLPAIRNGGSVEFRSGDMLAPELGEFDHVVGMDSIIHYEPADAVRVLAGLAARTRVSLVFTYVPSHPALEVMRAVGKLFPRGDRSPAVVPVTGRRLVARLEAEPRLAQWGCGRTERVSSGFYTSQALELVVVPPGSRDAVGSGTRSQEFLRSVPLRSQQAPTASPSVPPGPVEGPIVGREPGFDKLGPNADAAVRGLAR